MAVTMAGVASFLGAAQSIATAAATFFGKEKSVTIEKVETGTDIFKGERSYIALREFNLIRSQFQQTGEFVSREIDFIEPVSQVALFVSQQIPDEWPVGNWISYFLSTDKQSWSAVVPLSLAGNNKGATFIIPGGSTSRLYFKAVFTRPEDDPYRSPLLLHYAIQGIIAEGTL